MRGVVLLLSAAAALCGAAPAPPLEPVTCGGDQQETNAARFAMQHINENQNHGYKFKLAGVYSSKVEQEEQGCNITLQLSLQETTCHMVNPKHFEDCDVRIDAVTVVKANCTVVLSLQNLVANVLSHKCETTLDDTLHRRCPDCPTLLPLNNTQIRQYVVDAVRQFNSDSSFIQNYFVLRDIGRTSASYMMGMGMQYVTEFAMMETHCPIRTKVVPERCTPLCPDRAQYVICSSINSISGSKLECKTYPALNQTDLGLGEQEPRCPRPHHHIMFPSLPKVAVEGPVLQAAVEGPPLQVAVEGPPLQVAVEGPVFQTEVDIPRPPGFVPRPSIPGHPHNLCTTGTVDPAIHPICDWPRIRHPQPMI